MCCVFRNELALSPKMKKNQNVIRAISPIIVNFVLAMVGSITALWQETDVSLQLQLAMVGSITALWHKTDVSLQLQLAMVGSITAPRHKTDVSPQLQLRISLGCSEFLYSSQAS